MTLIVAICLLSIHLNAAASVPLVQSTMINLNDSSPPPSLQITNQSKDSNRNLRSTYPTDEIDVGAISGAAFGGSLYLCSFISYNGDACKYITTPDSYYLFVQNDLLKITGQLSTPRTSRILSTVNIEFFDEQGRTSALYARSLNGVFSTASDSESPVHYRFLDDNTKDIRLLECSSSKSAYLLNDRRQIYIAILPTSQGLWLSVNMHKELVDRSRGVLIGGISTSLTEDMLSFGNSSKPDLEIAHCYIQPSSKVNFGLNVPTASMGGNDASTQLQRICVDSLRRGYKSPDVMQQQYNQINQRTHLLNPLYSTPGQLPLYLTKLEASFEPYSVFKSVSSSPMSHQPLSDQRVPVKSGSSRTGSFKHQCTCLESLPVIHYPRLDPLVSDGSTLIASNRSAVLIYPRSMMAVQENENKDILMKGLILSPPDVATDNNTTTTNTSIPIRLESKDGKLVDLDENQSFSNFVVRYDSDGAYLTRSRRSNVIDDLKPPTVNVSESTSPIKPESDKKIELSEFSLLNWVEDSNYKDLLCSLSRELNPNGLIVSLKPKRYLKCSLINKDNDGNDDHTNNKTKSIYNDVAVIECDDDNGLSSFCTGSYNLIISL